MLTRREQNFVMHGMLAHLELTKMGHSIVYDEKEKLRIESIGTPYLDPKSDRAITTNALTKLSHATI